MKKLLGSRLSIFDNGNNNVLATLARSDFPPYGIDFPGGEATGQHLGLNHFIPPHIDSSSVDISKGLNYASAGAGILDETGYILGQRITMDQQLDNHFATIIKLAATNGSNIFDHLSKCLYAVNIGSNDYLNNYYTPGYLTRLFYTPEQYAALLIDRYTGQLKSQDAADQQGSGSRLRDHLLSDGADCRILVVPGVSYVVLKFQLDPRSGRADSGRFPVAGVVHGLGSSKPQVPCFFIFGDSLSDSGNNNGLQTLAKANFLPYGIDFPDGPTGRFTNGRTTVDLIGDLMGLENYILPFSNASGQQILQGVNYASGSAGIRNETGQHVGGRIALEIQLQNHQETIRKISEQLGEDAANDHLNSCLYSTYIGSNDYMLNYFGSGSSATREHTPEEFTNDLIDRYSAHLQELHEYGARKIAIFGLGPLGCLPIYQFSGGCNEDVNNAIQFFNSQLRILVDQLNHIFPDARHIFVNTFSIVSPNLSSLGLGILNTPCCGVGQLYCLPLSVPCKNRNGYAYWDNAHPTEAANKVLATRAYNAQHPNDTYPMDISHLVQSNGQDTYSHGVVMQIGFRGSIVLHLMLCAISVIV
ncbi:GDSL esterase/lipase-like protein [Drosera capensis]